MGRIFVLIFLILFGLLNIVSIFLPFEYPLASINAVLARYSLKIEDKKDFYFNPLLLSFSSDYIGISSDQNITFEKKISIKTGSASFNPFLKTFVIRDAIVVLPESFSLLNDQDLISVIKNITNDNGVEFFDLEINFKDSGRSLFFDKLSIYKNAHNIDVAFISRIKTKNEANNTLQAGISFDIRQDKLQSLSVFSDLFELKYFNAATSNVYFKAKNISNLLKIDSFGKYFGDINEFSNSFQLDGEFSSNGDDFFYGELKMGDKKTFNIKGVKRLDSRVFILKKASGDSDVARLKKELTLKSRDIYLENQKVKAKDNEILYVMISFARKILDFSVEGDMTDLSWKSGDDVRAFSKVLFDVRFKDLGIFIKKLKLESSDLNIDILDNKFQIIDRKLLFLPSFIESSEFINVSNIKFLKAKGELELFLNSASIQSCKVELNDQDAMDFAFKLNKENRSAAIKFKNSQIDNVINIKKFFDSEEEDQSDRQKLLMYYFDKNEYDFKLDIENSKINNFLLEDISLEIGSSLNKKHIKAIGKNDFFSGSFDMTLSKENNLKTFNIKSDLSILDIIKIRKMLGLSSFAFDRSIHIPSFLGFNGDIDLSVDNLIFGYNSSTFSFKDIKGSINIDNGIFAGNIKDKSTVNINLSFDLQSTPRYEFAYSLSGLQLDRFIDVECTCLKDYIRGGLFSFQGKGYSSGFNLLNIMQSAKSEGVAFIQNLELVSFDLNFLARNLLYKKTNWKSYLENKKKISYIPQVKLDFSIKNGNLNGNFNFEKDLISSNGSLVWNFNSFMFEEAKGVFVIGSKDFKTRNNTYIYIPFGGRVKCYQGTMDGIVDWGNLENFIKNGTKGN